MKRWLKIFVPVMGLMLIMSGIMVAEAKTDEEETHELMIMGTTDLHQYIMPYDYMDGEEVDDYGLPLVYSAVQELREEYDNTILVDSGDHIQGSLAGVYESQVDPLEEGETQAIVKAMNYMGYDAAAVGNHEVQDYGLDFLDRAVEGAEYPYLSANIYEADDEDELAFNPYTIVEKEIDGQELKVGIISFVPPQIMDWGASWLEGEVTTEEIVESAKQYVPELEEDTDIVVVAAHTGISDAELDSDEALENAAYHLANEVEGIDAMVLGHQHNRLPSEDYEGMDNVDNEDGYVHDVPAVMPGSWGDSLGTIDLELKHNDGEWEVIGAEVELLDTEGYESAGEIVDIVEDTHESTIEYVNTPIGETEVPLNSYFSLVKDTPVIQLINEAQLWFAEEDLQGTEYEDMPVLSAAAPFVAGREAPEYYTEVDEEIYVSDVTDIYIYDNTVQYTQLNGEEVIDWLESSAQNFSQLDPEADEQQNILAEGFDAYNFDIIEGIEYEIDITQPVGERIENATYEGEPLTEDDEFIVATNNYRGGGGGPFPEEITDNVVLERADVNREVIIQYIEEHDPIAPEASDNWSIKLPNVEGEAIFRSHPEAGEYIQEMGIDKIDYLEEDDEGWGIYEYQFVKEKPEPVDPKEVVMTVGERDEDAGLDVAPFIEEQRTYVPLRFMSESLGAHVDWDREESKAVINIDDKVLKFSPDSTQYSINGESGELEDRVILDEERTFLPISAVSQVLGYQVYCDEETEQVTVNR